MLQPTEEEYQEALNTLRRGGIVAYPTETFYGLAVDPDNEQAIAALYALKQRNSSKPLSILISDESQLSTLACYIPDVYKTLIQCFWPGPLTLVCSRPAHLRRESSFYSKKTLAVRISSHSVATQLCRLWGKPITATSANVSGNSPLLSAEEVRDLWGTKVDYILDGGKNAGGKGSTIVQWSHKTGELAILREGVVETGKIVKSLAAYDIICKS
jgi:L-threonylcarbamoyladenylate synthase